MRIKVKDAPRKHEDHEEKRKQMMKPSGESLKKLSLVIPAKAGIQPFQQIAEELDPSLTSCAVESRWDDDLSRGSLRGRESPRKHRDHEESTLTNHIAFLRDLRAFVAVLRSSP